MNNISPKQIIVNIIRQEYDRAVEKARCFHAEHMGTIAAANVWDKYNDQDGIGGISQNPYNITFYSERDEKARIYAAQMKEVYDLAVDTFLSNKE